MLYTIEVNKKATQLAYRLKYFPYGELTEQARKYVGKGCSTAYKTKQELLAAMQEGSDTVYLHHTCGTIIPMRLVWAYNNIPTKQEWDKWNNAALLIVQTRWDCINQEWFAIVSFKH